SATTSGLDENATAIVVVQAKAPPDIQLNARHNARDAGLRRTPAPCSSLHSSTARVENAAPQRNRTPSVGQRPRANSAPASDESATASQRSVAGHWGRPKARTTATRAPKSSRTTATAGIGRVVLHSGAPRTINATPAPARRSGSQAPISRSGPGQSG